MLKKITRGKNKGKWNVLHCHGKDKGKPINKKPMSHKKALAMHRAIQANKKRNSKWNKFKRNSKWNKFKRNSKWNKFKGLFKRSN